MTELRTSRLLLRALRDSDVAELTALNTHPDVVRYVNAPDADPAVRDASFQERIADHWVRFGFGPWAVIGTTGELDGRLVGLIGVMYPEFLPQLSWRPELGWRVAPWTWGQGVASEAATAARDDAFGRLGLPELISIIHPDNTASQRVAAKLGMQREADVLYEARAMDVQVWQLPAG